MTVKTKAPAKKVSAAKVATKAKRTPPRTAKRVAKKAGK